MYPLDLKSRREHCIDVVVQCVPSSVDVHISLPVDVTLDQVSDTSQMTFLSFG